MEQKSKDTPKVKFTELGQIVTANSAWLQDYIMGMNWGELLLIDDMILLFTEDDSFTNLRTGQTMRRQTVINAYSNLVGCNFAKIAGFSVDVVYEGEEV